MDRRSFLRGAARGGAALSALSVSGLPAARAAAKAHDAPNVLLVIIDSLRVDHLGAFAGRDAKAKTPNIDALARDSLRFSNVFPTAMPTVPARRTIVSGRRVFPYRHWHRGEGSNRHPGWAPITSQTFLHAFRDAGYWTGYVTDNPFLAWTGSFEHFRSAVGSFHPLGGQVGLDGDLDSVSLGEARRWLPTDLRHGHEHRVEGMRRYLVNTGDGRDEDRTCAARVFKRGADVLEDVSKHHRPFMLVVDSFDPHEPWAPPRKYLEMYDVDPDGQISGIPRYRSTSYLERGELATMKGAYAGEVTLTDRWLGHLLDRLRDLGREDDTVVMLISDHGLFLGEHNLTGKVRSKLYDELIHVPMLIRDPGRRRRGEQTDYPASTPDVAPTLLRMAGIKPPHSMHMQGRNVSRLLDGESARDKLPERELLFGGYANHFYAREGRWTLSANNKAQGAVLNDISHDPRQGHNIAGSHRRVVKRLYGEVVEATGGKDLPYYENG